MTDFLFGTLTFVVRVIGFVLDVIVTIERMQSLARYWTGADRLIAVPADPKALSPAAQRALAEAEARWASVRPSQRV